MISQSSSNNMDSQFSSNSDPDCASIILPPSPPPPYYASSPLMGMESLQSHHPIHKITSAHDHNFVSDLSSYSVHQNNYSPTRDAASWINPNEVVSRGHNMPPGWAPNSHIVGTAANSVVGAHPNHLNTNQHCYPNNFPHLFWLGFDFVLQKNLKKSDVSNAGRIVLPKKESEERLPILPFKEGIQLALKELLSPVIWNAKFRFWPNNRSRMYVLENMGDYVRFHGLAAGDSIALYRDQWDSQLHVVANKGGRFV